jgi:hypothetical protein
MLTGLDAFEACWASLHRSQSTSAAENMAIAHGMGRVIDGYGTIAEVESALPRRLQPIFHQLVVAYLQGYEPTIPTSISGLKAGLKRSNLPFKSNFERVRALMVINPNEAETLIVDRRLYQPE